LFKKDELTILLATTKEQKKETLYKENALVFLKELYAYADFKNTYNNALYTIINTIKDDMQKIDFVLEKQYVETKVVIDKHSLYKKPLATYTEVDKKLVPRFNVLLKKHTNREEKLVGHRWMASNFESYNTIENIEKPSSYLKEFKNAIAVKAYQKFNASGDINALERYLEEQIIDFYYKKSLNVADANDVELRYINKN